MAEQHRTPDILGSVLSGQAPGPAPGAAPAPAKAAAKRQTAKQQNSKTERYNTGKTVNHQNGKTENQQDSEPQAEADKIKATFYLALSAVEGLEEAWLQLRRQARGAGRKRAISKSEIVEMALQLMLEDLEAHGEASQISYKLLNRAYT
jgi:hypothetical protein